MAEELEVDVVVASQLEANTRLVFAAQVHQLSPPRIPFIVSLSHRLSRASFMNRSD
jgi:hypothetical protein